MFALTREDVINALHNYHYDTVHRPILGLYMYFVLSLASSCLLIFNITPGAHIAYFNMLFATDIYNYIDNKYTECKHSQLEKQK